MHADNPYVLTQLDQNELNILRLLRQNGHLTRNEIAELINLSRTKSIQLLENLITKGIVETRAIGESRGGRRPDLLGLRADFVYLVGIHMGATGASVCVANFRGEIMISRRIAYVLRGNPQKILDQVLQHTLEMLKECDISPGMIRSVGVGVPAPVEKRTNAILSPAIMVGWEHYPIHDHFSQFLPNAVVRLMNDASQMALGEFYAGLGRGHDNFIFVKVGTGIGCGIISNGEVFHGTGGCSGHIGHVSVDRDGPVCHCGNVGCLEKIVAASAIADRAMQAAIEASDDAHILSKLFKENGELSAKDVGIAAAAGDKRANDIIVQSGEILGKILATLVSFFNPSLIIIGGGVSNIGPQFLVSIHRTILQYSLPLSTKDVSIQKSELGYRAGLEGAVALAFSSLFHM